jgi:hypothetical protein
MEVEIHTAPLGEGGGGEEDEDCDFDGKARSKDPLGRPRCRWEVI